MQGNNQKDVPGQKPSSLSWSQPPPPMGTSSQKASPITPPKILTKPSATPVTALMPKLYGRNTLITAFSGGLLVGILFGWVWFSGSEVSPTTSTSPIIKKDVVNNTIPQGALSSGSAFDILVETQGAGLSVNVSNVLVNKPTWVVVYENRNGELGNVLGARLFFSSAEGGSSEGTVSLLRATSPEQTYFVGQYIDDGDRKFSTQSDTRVLAADGSPLITSFRTN